MSPLLLAVVDRKSRSTAEYVGSHQEFERIKHICHSLVRGERTLPDQVSRTSYGYYRFADFNGLFTSKVGAWDSILAFAQRLDTGPLSLLILDPVPESYQPWSSKYGAIVIDLQDQVSDVREILSVSPEEDMREGISANGVIVIGNRFVVFSESSPNCCLWADRHHAVAIMGLSHYPMWIEAKETWVEIWCDVEDAIDQLFRPAFFPRHVPEGFCLTLVANYGGTEFCPRIKLY